MNTDLLLIHLFICLCLEKEHILLSVRKSVGKHCDGESVLSSSMTNEILKIKIVGCEEDHLLILEVCH